MVRYANIACDNLFMIKETAQNNSVERFWNVGDYIQILAIENLYKEMGVKSEDIVRIRMQELKSYRGDKLILPINLIVYGDNFFDGSDIAISEDIIPVFLGVHFYHYYFSEKTVDYFRRFGPVGCRDESVVRYLQKLGIPAYLGGCITITLPKRKKEPGEGKVYLVDAPKTLYPYLPDWIKENAVETTSAYFMSKEKMLNGKTMRKFVEEKYREYYESSSLVVTSRLHVASPCMAAGIPVILAREAINDRFAWIDKFINIYTPDTFASIEWNRKAVEIENEKRQILDSAMNMVKSQYARYHAMESLDAFYGNRKRCEYQTHIDMDIEPIITYMKENWDEEKEIKYAIWGWGVFADEVVKYAKHHYPNAKLVAIFDSYRTFEKYGIKSLSPAQLKNNKDYMTFITSDAVAYIAKKYFDEHAYRKDAFVMMKCCGAEAQSNEYGRKNL